MTQHITPEQLEIIRKYRIFQTTHQSFKKRKNNLLYHKQKPPI